MSSIGDILAGKKYEEPVEIARIKDFIHKKFDADVSVKIEPKNLVIYASSAALAGTLRLHSQQIAEACQTDKRLVIKIG